MKRKIIVALGVMMLIGHFLFSQTLNLTVTNTAEGLIPGTLRKALDSIAKVAPPQAVISFNINGPGPFTISLFSFMDVASDNVVIDATTQPGYTPGMIVIDMSEPSTSFSLSGDNCEIYGLQFSFSNLFGEGAGLIITGSNNKIGAPGKGNIFTENGICGIQLGAISQFVAGNIIQGNYIGALPDGNNGYLSRPNGASGILVKNVSNNLIGGTEEGQGNVIAYNPVGIELEMAVPVRMSGNQFFCNTNAGIITSAQAIAPPQIIEASAQQISGQGIAGSTVEVFNSSLLPGANFCFSGTCEGGVSIGTAIVQPDNSWRLSTGNIVPGSEVVAIATSASGESSAFSECNSVTCTVDDLVVTNTQESGPGSLLAALSCAITFDQPVVISFNIAGPPPWEISLVSGGGYQISKDRMTIDATTQPGYTPGSVIIDGAGVTEYFHIFGDSVNIYGLHFRNFTLTAFSIGGRGNIIGAPGKGNIFTESAVGFALGEGSEGTRIQSNYFGTAPDTTGDLLPLANRYGVTVLESDDIQMGGVNPDEENIIAYNDTAISIDRFSSGINFSGNRLFCNGEAILFENELTNMGIISPVIDSASVDTISGTSTPGDTITVYAVDSRNCILSEIACQGKYIVGKTIAGNDGNWKIPGNYALSGLGVTAIATDNLGNSSMYANCMDIPVVEEVITVITAPGAFTPDGDGLNEQFIIKNIENFPDNELIVLNRWGNQVYYSRSYKNDWTGTTTAGQPLLEGTYFYVLRIVVNGVKQTTRGAITIVR
ncbi:MAG: gliding motility-associated C-terminal domain-containing protein [Bacteroidia bacterium]